MKVVQINVCPNGSTGTIMMNIHNELQKRNIESYVVWGRGRKSLNDYEIYMNDKLGVFFHVLYSRITGKVGFASRRATKKLLKKLDKIQPDVIHLHNIHGYYINIKMLFEYLRNRNIKVIWTLHDCWAFTGHCSYFSYVNCQKWKTACNNCPQKKSYPCSYVFDNSKSNYILKKELFTSLKSARIITPSNWLANLCRESFLNKYPIEVINNGIDLNIFKKTDVNLSKYNIDTSKKIILGVASGWEERKGIRDFFELAQVVDDSYQIVMVGLKEKQFKELPSNIIGIQRTDSKEELVALYSIATVLFNPTYEDNYPTVNLESIACETPVITYRTGGSPEFINQNEVGKVIDYRDYKALLDCVDYYEINKINISNEIMTNISNNRMVNQYINLYKKIF